MDELMIKVDNVGKKYKLGQIGGTTFREEMQRLSAKLRKKEDPTVKIGAATADISEEFWALKGVSFEVKKGERVGIIGHNGAGKSTLLKLLSRITAPTEGVIGLNGRVASMLEVGTGFHPELTGRENIYMNGAILGMTKKEIDAKMEEIIEFSECRQFIDTPVKRYSSGMYVKLAFSVAAHLDSEIMIMDEVLAVGDMSFQKKCLEKMTETSEKEGKTILYVSHNMNTIRQLCDRCIVLDKGTVVYQGEVERAIELYLGDKTDTPSVVELSELEHSSMANKKVVINKIEVLSETGWHFPVGSKMKFQIFVTANASIKNVGYRSRLATVEGQSVTVLMAPKLFDCKIGEQLTIPLEADVSQLVPGRYCLTPVLYGVNQFGGWEFYDHIDGAVTFEIENKLGFNENMEWDPHWWGHVKFQNLRNLRKNDADL